MSSFTEPISPELALVSPELAAIARAGLPDRPWESFLPPAVEIAPLRPPTIPEPRTVSQPAAEPAGSRSGSRRRPRVPVGLIILVAFVGLVVAGSVLPVRDAPTLGPPPARANGLSVPQAPPTTPQSPQVSTTPVRSTFETQTVPADVPRRSTTTTTKPAAPHPTRLEVVRPQVLPRGGYVLAGGLGRLQVGVGARSIAEIHMNIRCGGEIVIRRIRITSDGRFSARRVVLGPVRSTVSITGRFARAGTVHGAIRVTKGRCASGPIDFTGRLS